MCVPQRSGSLGWALFNPHHPSPGRHIDGGPHASGGDFKVSLNFRMRKVKFKFDITILPRTFWIVLSKCSSLLNYHKFDT